MEELNPLLNHIVPCILLNKNTILYNNIKQDIPQTQRQIALIVINIAKISIWEYRNKWMFDHKHFPPEVAILSTLMKLKSRVLSDNKIFPHTKFKNE